MRCEDAATRGREAEGGSGEFSGRDSRHALEHSPAHAESFSVGQTMGREGDASFK